jgi:hypothetical protein
VQQVRATAQAELEDAPPTEPTGRRQGRPGRLPYCVTGLGAPLHRDRVSYDMIYHVLATSLYDDPAAGVCGDAPAGLDEHPEHGL